MASAADALFRLPALTYSKGAAVIRQLAALIGDDALRAGLADFMRRFGGGSAGLDDLIACWSRSSGRDLGGWADEWLRTEGASTLRGAVVAAADGTIGSLTVRQDEPRTHRLGIGLYDRAGAPGGLRRRRVISAEVSGPVSEVAVPAGEAMPDALVLNDGDLSYAEIAFDPATLEALTRAAMDVGDPLTEAVCWNAAWRMVTAGSPVTGALAAADFAGLVIRRLRGSGVLAGGGGRGAARAGGDRRRPVRARCRTVWVACGHLVRVPGRRIGRGGGKPAAARAGRRFRGERAYRLSSSRSRVCGWMAGRGRTAWSSTVTCAGTCCGRWRPAGSPRTKTSEDLVAADPVAGRRPGHLPRAAAGRRGQAGGLGGGAGGRGGLADGGGGGARYLGAQARRRSLAGRGWPPTATVISPRRCPRWTAARCT